MKQLFLLSGLLLLAACDSGTTPPAPAPTDGATAPAPSDIPANDPALDAICDSQTPTAACDSEEYRNARAEREEACKNARSETDLSGQTVTDPSYCAS